MRLVKTVLCVLICLQSIHTFSDVKLDQELLAYTAKGNVKEVERCLKQGANVNAVDVNGMTALMMAAEYNSLELAALLIKAGTNTALKNKKGETVYDIAKRRNNTALINLLNSAKETKVPIKQDQKLNLKLDNTKNKIILPKMMYLESLYALPEKKLQQTKPTTSQSSTTQATTLPQSDEPCSFVIAPGSPFTLPSTSYSECGELKLGDLNGDRNLDIIVDPKQNIELVNALGKGDGSFQPTQKIAAIPYQLNSRYLFLELLDYNNDQRQDILAITYEGDNRTNKHQILLWPNKGDGTFQPQLVVGQSPAYQDWKGCLSDINADGKADLVISSFYAKQFTILNGTGTGFTAFSQARQIAFPQTMAYYFDNLVVIHNKIPTASYEVVTYPRGGASPKIHATNLTNGQTRFLSHTTSGGGPLLVADFNADGMDEIVMGETRYGRPYIDICSINDTGNYTQVFTFNPDGLFYSSNNGIVYKTVIAPADINNDGNLDLVMGARAGNRLVVLLGDGKFNFVIQAMEVSSPDVGFSVLRAGDVNKDGRTDLVAGFQRQYTSPNPPHIVVLLNTGSQSTKPLLAKVNIPTGFLETDFSFPLACIGGGKPLTWSIVAGTLPAGLTLNAASGVVAGRPTTVGTNQVGITVTDASGKTFSRDYTFTVVPRPALAFQYYNQVVSAFDFGKAKVGVVSSASFWLRNMGGGTVTITTLTSSHPAFVIPNPVRSASGYQPLTIDFVPTAIGPVTGKLTIATNSTDTPLIEVELSGTGYREPTPDMSLNLQELVFGETKVNTPKELQFAIRNLGSQALTISKAEINSSQFRLSTPLNNVVIQTDGISLPKVIFTPSDVGRQQGTLILTTNDPKAATLTIPLSGAGVY
jgi:hypothetical protein